MLNLKQPSRKRQRGVFLSDRGLAKILEARRHSEQHENQGEPYTAEKLGERTGLDPHTICKVFNRNAKVDKQTLQLCFNAFNLTLKTDDYQKFHCLNGELETYTNLHRLPGNSKTIPHYDLWAEVPDITHFCGRTTELAQLKQWISSEQCRFVMLSGQSGIGKTFLVAKGIEQLHANFQLTIWRSLSTLPPIREFLTELIQSFPNASQDEVPKTIQGKLSRLMHRLRTFRCLLVLDGIEPVLQASPAESESEVQANTSRKIPDWEWYRRLLKRLGEVPHKSCVIVTACQTLPEIKHFVGENLPRRLLRLKGLTIEDGKALCNTGKTLQGSQTEWEDLIQYYGGNPLLLKIAATTIHKLFNGQVAEFLHCNIKLYGEIRQRLEQQFQALSAPERRLLCYIAQQPDGVAFKDLHDRSQPLMPMQAIVEALEALEGRALIEKQGDCFVLQPAIRDSATIYCKGIDPSRQISDS